MNTFLGSTLISSFNFQISPGSPTNSTLLTFFISVPSSVWTTLPCTTVGKSGFGGVNVFIWIKDCLCSFICYSTPLGQPFPTGFATCTAHTVSLSKVYKPTTIALNRNCRVIHILRNPASLSSNFSATYRSEGNPTAFTNSLGLII